MDNRRFQDSFYETRGNQKLYDPREGEPEDRILNDLFNKIQDTEKNVSAISNALNKMRQSRGQSPFNRNLYNDSKGYFGDGMRNSRNRLTPNKTGRPAPQRDQLEHFLDSVLQDDKPRYND
mmetsp:Transcript_21801/g.20945  ORF Transcript_21801/g.20945 Transcript_21801/m.20945 type:complete len:121 (+) Transcript_21801:1093-1455(+)|eukprot:CAMPEP_0170553066 /NCGR_PEP_ID=MMETSP0211-20121228/10924_1 /TAXON_ID=311385 /ORGANISM="Pseudokeronopsis sp., Strain OXSARD2" /LENGTH=120 /DNA_ID=CAMNT_0010861193 /DNA_START=2380 /DNA_END=2742 /DNA_ORIENTATION=-